MAREPSPESKAQPSEVANGRPASNEARPASYSPTPSIVAPTSEGNHHPPLPESHTDLHPHVQHLEHRMKRFEKWTLWLTGAMALFAFGSMIAAGFQWAAMKGQLKEMHDGGTDTHALADAADRQAVETKQQVDKTAELAQRMKEQADQTKTIAEEARAQALAASLSAKAADQSSKTAQSELELSQRPWLVSKATVTEDLQRFLEHSAFKISISVTNIGHSPATEVSSFAESWVGDNNDWRPFEEKRKRVCAFADQERSTLGKTLFPEQQLEDKEDLVFHDREFKPEPPPDDTEPYPYVNPNLVIVTTCTMYRSSFGNQQYMITNNYILEDLSTGSHGPIGYPRNVTADKLVLLPSVIEPVESK